MLVIYVYLIQIYTHIFAIFAVACLLGAGLLTYVFLGQHHKRPTAKILALPLLLVIIAGALMYKQSNFSCTYDPECSQRRSINQQDKQLVANEQTIAKKITFKTYMPQNDSALTRVSLSNPYAIQAQPRELILDYGSQFMLYEHAEGQATLYSGYAYMKDGICNTSTGLYETEGHQIKCAAVGQLNHGEQVFGVGDKPTTTPNLLYVIINGTRLVAKKDQSTDGVLDISLILSHLNLLHEVPVTQIPFTSSVY
jgi:hypothetical protein